MIYSKYMRTYVYERALKFKRIPYLADSRDLSFKVVQNTSSMLEGI